MIDTHIHMIPDVDDGAKDMNIAIQMLHMAINEGVNKMILTPHFNIPLHQNENVNNQYNLLEDYIRNKKIDFKIYLGNEIYLNEETMEGVLNGQANTMGGSSYLLVELPHYHFYPFHEAMIQDLQNSGYKVILAHIERYRIFAKKPDKLQELVEKGVFAQITSHYIIDSKTRRKAIKWIKSGLIHIVASDGHDVDKRPPVMKIAYDVVFRRFGKNCAQVLFVDNPELIIENRDLKIPICKKSKIYL